MEQHFPRGSRISALEKNELKRRALEMVMILFYVEDLKKFVVSSIKSTDRFSGRISAERLPHGTKKLYQKAWEILVDECVITQGESSEIQKIINYRNTIAHKTQELTGEIGRYPSIRKNEDPPYDSSALKRIICLREKVFSGMQPRFVLSLSFRGLLFESAEKTYKEELGRLRKKINKQYKALENEVTEVNAVIKKFRDSGLLAEIQPGHPEHTNRNGTLSAAGVSCCRRLFCAEASPLVVAYLMRISLRSSKRQYDSWRLSLVDCN